MRGIVEQKLKIISSIWNNYILNYKYCNSKIKFTPDVKSNYFGDILCNFYDGFEIIYRKKKTNTFEEHMENSIIFLQIIYTQQDFMEELLSIFKCGINKGNLKKDHKYSVNRDLRNELIGHPIRKDSSNKLISSTIFSSSLNSTKISYVRYHIDNNYKHEEITHSKEEILARHNEFLVCYFDIIIKNLQKILLKFRCEIENIERIVFRNNFEQIVQVVSVNYNFFLTHNYLFDTNIILEVYRLRHSHRRYENSIELFIKDLKNSLLENKNEINNLLKKSEDDILSRSKELHFENYIEGYEEYVDEDVENLVMDTDEKYYYEMEKLFCHRNNISLFMLFCSSLRHKKGDNLIISEELDNMMLNLDNVMEYYCSYYLIDRTLNKAI